MINEDDKVNKGTVVKMEPAAPPKKVAEQDIFGGAVSDSEEEDAQLIVFRKISLEYLLTFPLSMYCSRLKI